MPLSFGLNLGASTDASVEDLSLTGSCTSVRTTVRKYTEPENYIPRHPANGGGYKIIKKKKRDEINGAEANQVCPWVRILESKQRCGSSSTMTSWLTLLYRASANARYPEPHHLKGHWTCLECLRGLMAIYGDGWIMDR